MNVLRYDETDLIVTDLDPIEDILNLITALKSTGFTSDLLRDIHGFTDSNEIKKTSKLISLHVENAVSLANQGFDGPPQTSFLPLYYSTLNLAKVYLLFLGKRIALESNRWHGAKYSEQEMSRNFLNEKIKISNRGTIPLLYNSITNKTIGRSGFDLTINELYRNITSIGAEFKTITKQESGLMPVNIEFVNDATNGHYMKVHIRHDYYQNNPPQPRCLKAFPGLHIMADSNGNYYYETRKYKGRLETVKQNLISKIKRQLNCDYAGQGRFGGVSWVTLTPINGKFHVMNEDLSIMLAYFHLSNVVRYNPEHLYKLMDSKYWVLMLGLRKHGFLRFEKLMWSNFNKKSFDVL
jgi:hypothetical protein